MEKLKGFFKGLVEGGISGIFAALGLVFMFSATSLFMYGMYHLGEKVWIFLKAVISLIF